MAVHAWAARGEAGLMPGKARGGHARRARQPSAEDREARRALDALYARVPELKCKGLCQESCGPIRMSRQEWKRITDRVGDDAKRLKGKDGITCPLLTNAGHCRVYSNRPLICRLWGVVAIKMECPWGCIPERFLTDEEARAMLAEAERIGR